MADDFQERSDDFVEWLSKLPSASISSKVKLKDLRHDGRGRSVVAIDNIDEDEDLFTIPRSSIISVENSELCQLLPTVFEELDPWLSLILVLTYEYFKGYTSFWKPYLDVLPHDFNTLMFWSEEELVELQASPVLEKIGKKSADKTFTEQLLPILEDHSEVFFPANAKVRPTSEELLALAHRFGSTIMAYAFDIEKDESQLQLDDDGWASDEELDALPKGMVPMADMLNADAEFNAHLYHGERILFMRAVKPIKNGEEVLNSYGELPRSDLLRRYGYITPSYAQYDVVELSCRSVIDAVRQHQELDEADLERRLEFLDDEGILDDAYVLTHKNDNDSCFPDELKTTVQVLIVQKEDVKKIDKLNDDRKKSLRADFGNIMKIAAENQLKQYATTVAEDHKMLEDPSIQGRLRDAIEVRLGEKKILAEAIAEASEYFQDLDEDIDADTARPSKRHKTSS